ncbi:MAG: wax ester/triacylglycerol synthase family O-acyltransferase [Frankiaceae bacterium]
MADRLSPLDVSFLYMEEPSTPMHVGSVQTYADTPQGVQYEQLCQLITERITAVPRFRQKIRWVPGRLASPVWIDDPDFDVTYHVRRSALPKPGSDAQLRELAARVQSRHLDRSRPLWEMYIVEGLSEGRFAILTKTHHAMVDGLAAVDIGQLIMDATPEPRTTPVQPWQPRAEPSSLALVGDAVKDYVRRPTAVVDAARSQVADLRALPMKAAHSLLGFADMARTAVHPAKDSPLNADIREQRRFGTADTELDDYKRIRKSHGGTVNDAVLATVTGALRQFLLTRGEPVNPRSTIRAMVPVSVKNERTGEAGNHVSSFYVDLPIGEENPVVRLHQVSYAMGVHKESGQSVAADALVAIGGFAPPTLHALGARVASGLSRRLFNIVVTNVPGPQFPLYAAGAQMLQVYPVVPLAKGQAVSIGLTSYNGGVYYGLLADRDAMADVDVMGGLLVESLAELVRSVR